MDVFLQSGSIGANVPVIVKSGCIWAKVVVVGRRGCNRVKVVLLGQSGNIQARSGSIRAIVVVFRVMWLFSGKSGCIRAKWLYSGKVVVLGQSCSIRANVPLFWKNGCI